MSCEKIIDSTLRGEKFEDAFIHAVNRAHTALKDEKGMYISYTVDGPLVTLTWVDGVYRFLFVSSSLSDEEFEEAFAHAEKVGAKIVPVDAEEVVIMTTLTGGQFDTEFMKRVRTAHTALVDEEGRYLQYTVDGPLVEINWVDGIHRYFFISSTLTGEEFEEDFARAVKADAKVGTEMGNKRHYEVMWEGDQWVAQIFWDDLYHAFVDVGMGLLYNLELPVRHLRGRGCTSHGKVR